ncbi:uncharacterized protein LOC144440986 [Glandiceps talaboti]
MKVLVCVLLLAFVGVILAEDAAKPDAPAKKAVGEKKEVRRVHHMTVDEKKKLAERKKEYLNSHPEMKLDPEVVHQERRLMRERKDKIMQIKKSDLSIEEKRAQLKELKKEFAKHRKALVKSSKGGMRKRLTPEQKRAMAAQKKGGAVQGAITDKQVRIAQKKAGMQKAKNILQRPLGAKKSSMKKTMKTGK